MNILTDATFEAATTDQDKVVVVDFYADWCAPCRTLTPIMEELAKELPAASFYKLDVDKNPLTAGKHNVRSIPMLLFIKPNGTTTIHLGLSDKEDLTSMIEHMITEADEE